MLRTSICYILLSEPYQVTSYRYAFFRYAKEFYTKLCDSLQNCKLSSRYYKWLHFSFYHNLLFTAIKTQDRRSQFKWLNYLTHALTKISYLLKIDMWLHPTICLIFDNRLNGLSFNVCGTITCGLAQMVCDTEIYFCFVLSKFIGNKKKRTGLKINEFKSDRFL